MPAKFFCPKCERRFVDWGAEKLGYVCPTCGGEKLLRVGAREEDAEAAPTLKRKPAKSPRRASTKVSSSSGLSDSGDTDDSLGQHDYVGISDDDDNSSSGGDDDSDLLAADGGSDASLRNKVPGFEPVDQDD